MDSARLVNVVNYGSASLERSPRNVATARGESWENQTMTASILVVDDDAAVGKMLRDLISQEGYDAAWVPLRTSSSGPSDDIVLIAGRAGTTFSIDFPTDVWSFHPSSGTWTPIDVSGGPMPGRRFPAYTISPAHNAVLVAFGSDTAAGEHQLDDVWLFDLSTSTLRALDVAAADDGSAPTPRVFTPFVSSSEALLAGGIGIGASGHIQVLADDAFILHADADEWH